MVQYNEYYPFGLQTAESWTRPDDTRNPYLFNAGSEWNESSLVYETNFRDYDPAIGRFYANDPLSLQGHSLTPYRFGFNNPVSFNDPTGLYEQWDDYLDRKQSEYKISEWQRLGMEFISSDVVRGGSYGGLIKTTETTITTFRGTVPHRAGPRYGHGSSSSSSPTYVTFSVIHTTTTMSPNQGFIKFGMSGQNMEPPKGGGQPIGGDPVAQERSIQRQYQDLINNSRYSDAVSLLINAYSLDNNAKGLYSINIVDNDAATYFTTGGRRAVTKRLTSQRECLRKVALELLLGPSIMSLFMSIKEQYWKYPTITSVSFWPITMQV